MLDPKVQISQLGEAKPFPIPQPTYPKGSLQMLPFPLTKSWCLLTGLPVSHTAPQFESGCLLEDVSAPLF